MCVSVCVFVCVCVYVCVRVCVCVCVCLPKTEQEGLRAGICEHNRELLCVCVRVHESANQL